MGRGHYRKCFIFNKKKIVFVYFDDLPTESNFTLFLDSTIYLSNKIKFSMIKTSFQNLN